jgi:hypothetical protein
MSSRTWFMASVSARDLDRVLARVIIRISFIVLHS